MRVLVGISCLCISSAAFLAHDQLSAQAAHIPGITNVAADALPRNNLNSFLSAAPQY